ncbi:MAG: hypothetical protein AAFZ99_08145 [Pseudomonadota bacterium]
MRDIVKTAKNIATVATTTVICRRMSKFIHAFNSCCTSASVVPHVLRGFGNSNER